ncbi:hypothetical protein FACS189487_00570 [Campylobacterota bacterium]|nr:hypothetical protein FACS189487_00570 [Campylobacterota bacterium]
MVNLSGKPEIVYPCIWEYRLIGRERSAIESAVKSTAGDRDYRLEIRNTSSKGAFISMNFSLEVLSESERLAHFDNLRKSGAIAHIL